LNAEDVARYTSSGVWRNVTLAENARRQAEQDAQRIAVIEGNRSVNFGTLLAQANQLAAAFQTLGLRAGDVISFQLPNWIETMVINTAACIADLVVNPIVPIYREAEVRYILRDARPKLFFIPEQFRNFDYPAMLARLRAEVPGRLDSVVVRGRAPGCIEYEQLLASGAGRSPVWQKSDPKERPQERSDHPRRRKHQSEGDRGPAAHPSRNQGDRGGGDAPSPTG
jgi:non-ribosomal peptide synthetase component E (peptide arylation enzyme)